MNLKEKIIEMIKRKEVVVYHGDQRKISKLEIKSMYHDKGNFQEGVGIYFTDVKESAEKYGKYVYKTTINENNFINSRESLSTEKIYSDKIYKILQECRKYNKDADEELFYAMSDYVYIEEPEDINEDNLYEFAKYLEDEEVRNFQITIAEIFGVEAFVKAWNKILPNIYGTMYPNSDKEMWYAIINFKIKITEIN